MKNTYLNKYEINNSNINKSKRIAYISDIHGDYKKFFNIIKRLYRLNINTLLIGGDLIDNNYDVRNDDIRLLLDIASNYYNIYIALGNHDLVTFNNNHLNGNGEVRGCNEYFWNSISSIKNVHVSSIPNGKVALNKYPISDDIDLVSLCMPIEYYWSKESNEVFNKYVKALDNIKLDSNKYNILLSHSPKNIIINNEINEYLSNFDLILTGHMHSGLVPIRFRKEGIGSGLIGPYASFPANNAYGIMTDKDTTAIISGGVTKIAASSSIGRITNNNCLGKIIDTIYPSELELFEFNHSENNSVKKLTRK